MGQQPSKPNILWICTDQQRADTLGCYGNPFVHTPNLDALAASGVRFTNAYVQNPVCMPSRASFLTGRYPHTCGVRYNGQDFSKHEEVHLLPRILRNEGDYVCGLAGKLHLFLCNAKTTPIIEPRVDDGYDYFAWSNEHDPKWPLNAYTLWLKSCGMRHQRTPRADCRYVHTGMPPAYHQTKWCADRAIEFMDQMKDFGRHWMFSFNCFDPHHPFDPPAEYLERYLPVLDQLPLPVYREGELDNKSPLQRRNHEGAYGVKGSYAYDEMTDHDHRMVKAAYYAMCDFIDVQVGRMVDYLRDSGQLDNTIIIFHSDHGESLGDHGIYLKGSYFYESSVNVPLILSCPSLFRPGVVSNALVELIDLAPTLVDACGLAPHAGFQGQSLLPLLQGKTPADAFRDSVYSEIYADLDAGEQNIYSTMVFDGRYKLTKVHAVPKTSEGFLCVGELYDLERDPNETDNRYDDPAMAEIRQRMLEIMTDRMAKGCDPCNLSMNHHLRSRASSVS